MPFADLIHVEARDAKAALWAMEEGLRCAAIGAVVGEIWGDPASLDFTATRRLAVAAERHGVVAWLIRLGGSANLSGARRRWRVASAPSLSHPLNPRAPGTAVWDAELFRARGAVPGTWRLTHDLGCVWFPSGCRAWRERWTKLGSAAPDDRVALVEEGPHGQLIAAVTDAAGAAGARPGMRLTDARALDPGLIAVPADGDGDRALVERLSRWSSRWSPLVEVDGAELAVGFKRGGASVRREAGWLADIETRFAPWGTALVAVAERRGGVVVARFSAIARATG